ncbi:MULTISPECIES: hypothetical protein [Bradyrhizobium]|nr:MULTISPECIES: hypothetical protein [Bradyrhizobium]MBR0970912.1 hypothetical protein [Bradyrhizobium japonicum]
MTTKDDPGALLCRPCVGALAFGASAFLPSPLGQFNLTIDVTVGKGVR